MGVMFVYFVIIEAFVLGVLFVYWLLNLADKIKSRKREKEIIKENYNKTLFAENNRQVEYGIKKDVYYG